MLQLANIISHVGRALQDHGTIAPSIGILDGIFLLARPGYTQLHLIWFELVPSCAAPYPCGQPASGFNMAPDRLREILRKKEQLVLSSQYRRWRHSSRRSSHIFEVFVRSIDLSRALLVGSDQALIDLTEIGGDPHGAARRRRLSHQNFLAERRRSVPATMGPGYARNMSGKTSRIAPTMNVIE